MAKKSKSAKAKQAKDVTIATLARLMPVKEPKVLIIKDVSVADFERALRGPVVRKPT